ncbi:MAG: septum formation initiator family protein [Clostridia bacterium]|nr:septum formation initiator family protein [Clostridia bacterium]
MNRNSNVVLKLGAVLFVLIGIFTVARLEMKYNDIETQRQELEQQYKLNNEMIEELERELEAEFDDEYVVKIAKEKLNLCLPEEVIFYNDLTE